MLVDFVKNHYDDYYLLFCLMEKPLKKKKKPEKVVFEGGYATSAKLFGRDQTMISLSFLSFLFLVKFIVVPMLCDDKIKKMSLQPLNKKNN